MDRGRVVPAARVESAERRTERQKDNDDDDDYDDDDETDACGICIV